jgi:hypothetical protein
MGADRQDAPQHRRSPQHQKRPQEVCRCHWTLHQCFTRSMAESREVDALGDKLSRIGVDDGPSRDGAASRASSGQSTSKGGIASLRPKPAAEPARAAAGAPAGHSPAAGASDGAADLLARISASARAAEEAAQERDPLPPPAAPAAAVKRMGDLPPSEGCASSALSLADATQTRWPARTISWKCSTSLLGCELGCRRCARDWRGGDGATGRSSCARRSSGPSTHAPSMSCHCRRTHPEELSSLRRWRTVRARARCLGAVGPV